MVLVDSLTPPSVIEDGINKAFERVEKNNQTYKLTTAKALREAALFLYENLKPGTSYKALNKAFIKHHGKEIHEYCKALRIMLVNVARHTPGISIKLETRNFVYDPSTGYVRLKTVREEVTSCFIQRDFIDSGELREEQIRSFFILEIMAHNEHTLENRFGTKVMAQIRGMFGFGIEGMINSRLNIIAGHIQPPHYLKTLADKSPLCFLPTRVVNELIKEVPSLPKVISDHLALYKELGYISTGTIDELTQAIAVANKRDCLRLAEDSQWLLQA